MTQEKIVVSFRVPKDELTFYRQVAYEEELPLTELISRAMRKAYNPPLEHKWRCEICGKSMTSIPMNDCTGVPGDYEEDDTLST